MTLSTMVQTTVIAVILPPGRCSLSTITANTILASPRGSKRQTEGGKHECPVYGCTFQSSTGNAVEKMNAARIARFSYMAYILPDIKGYNRFIPDLLKITDTTAVTGGCRVILCLYNAYRINLGSL
jgi:hypothetical protein